MDFSMVLKEFLKNHFWKLTSIFYAILVPLWLDFGLMFAVLGESAGVLGRLGRVLARLERILGAYCRMLCFSIVFSHRFGDAKMSPQNQI